MDRTEPSEHGEDPADWWPQRPVLLPGVRVVTRDDGRRQVGCDPGRRVLLPGTAESRALLAALAAGRRPQSGSPEMRRVARDLADRRLVADAAEVAEAGRRAPSYDAGLAALARHGRAAVARLRSRAAARVALDVPDPDARSEVTRLLGRAGLREARRPAGAAARLVVTTDGEPDRQRSDPWMRSGLPHLWVTQRSGRLVVGPFVVAGLTACLRCRDAHDDDRDPGYAAVVAQLLPRPDDRPDPLLLDLALALAVHDLVAFVEGDLPATWSAVVEVDGAGLARRELSRHPRCGCSWGEGLATA